MALTKITPQMFDTSATAHDLNVDNGTFVVDGSASRVGIGTTTPSTLLDVNGTATATTFVGALTGNVTGNVSGTAATVTGAAQTNITSLGTLTALTVDDITINGSTISDAADLTIDVGGDINLDAAGDQINFKSGGTSRGYIDMSTGGLILRSLTGDADIILQGTDGSSSVNALILDMSNAGAATFNAGVTATTFTGTLATAAQTNITSLGTLTGLSISAGTSTHGLSFGATIPSAGQTILTYHDGNTRSGLGIVAGVHRMFTNNGAVLSFGEVSSSDGSTYSERMRIDTNGKVGIGTGSNISSSYGKKIHIHSQGSSGASVHLTDSGSGTANGDGFELISYNTSAYVWQRENANLHIGTNETTRVQIYPSTGGMDVNNPSTDKITRFINTGSGSQGITIGTTTNNSAGYGLHLGHQGTKGFVHPYNYASGGWTDLELRAANTTIKDANDVTLVNVHSNTNVGIGTGATTPSENLHIKSTATGDHTRVHIEKTSTAGTAGVSMTSTTPSHTWTIFQQDDSEGRLNLFNSAASKYPLMLTKDGTAAMNVTPLAWYTGQSMFQLGAQMTLHSENSNSTSNSAHMSLNAQLDTDGSWEYIASNQATNYYQYEGSHNWRQATAGTAGNDITWYDTMSLAQDTGVLKLRPVGYVNGPKNHAALNIGRASTGETRAIDIWGAWSGSESKSITFNHGNSASNIVGQINCIHYSPGSAIRWGKLYHNAEGTTYTMELRSVSQASSRLIINNSNIPGDAPINAQAGPANTGCFVGRSSSYTNPFGILPWSNSITYLSSGTHYSNGTWDYSQTTGTNNSVCLFVITGDSGIRWYAGNGSTPNSWNVANNVQLFNASGVMVASTSSDRRLKDNITNLDSTEALTKVKALQAVSFEWNEIIKRKRTKAYADGTQYGFIAQDVKEVWPDAHIISDSDKYDETSPTEVMDKDDTYYGDIEGVRQEKLIPLLVESIKAQQTMIEALQAEVKALKGE